VDVLWWLRWGFKRANERNFLGRNRKISPNWTGPYRILQVFHNGVVELQLSNRKIRANVARIKPYIAPIQLQQPLIDLPPVSDFNYEPTNFKSTKLHSQLGSHVLAQLSS
jgi:hypothetical protein